MTIRHLALCGALLLAALPTAGVGQEMTMTPASPQGNVASWFPQDIYPPEAKRNGQQGRVVVQLAVDKSGAATACKIIESSGSSALDARTCELALANARFNPAKDANGKPVETTFTLPGVRWALKDDYVNVDLSAGAVSNVRSMEIMVDAQGRGVTCRPLAAGAPADLECANFRPGVQVSPPLILNGKPVAGKVTITTTMRVEPK